MYLLCMLLSGSEILDSWTTLFDIQGESTSGFCASGWHLSLWSNLSLWPFFADPRSPFVFSRDACPRHKLRHVETFRQLKDTTVDLVGQRSSAWRPASQCHLVSPCVTSPCWPASLTWVTWVLENQSSSALCKHFQVIWCNLVGFGIWSKRFES